MQPLSPLAVELGTAGHNVRFDIGLSPAVSRAREGRLTVAVLAALADEWGTDEIAEAAGCDLDTITELPGVAEAIETCADCRAAGHQCRPCHDDEYAERRAERQEDR